MTERAREPLISGQMMTSPSPADPGQSRVWEALYPTAGFSDPPSCEDPQEPRPAGCQVLGCDGPRAEMLGYGAGSLGAGAQGRVSAGSLWFPGAAARLSCGATAWPPRDSPLPDSSPDSVAPEASRKDVGAPVAPRGHPWSRVCSSLKALKDVSQHLTCCSPVSPRPWSLQRSPANRTSVWPSMALPLQPALALPLQSLPSLPPAAPTSQSCLPSPTLPRMPAL